MRALRQENDDVSSWTQHVDVFAGSIKHAYLMGETIARTNFWM